MALASRLHEHDRRQREPYLNHPLRVAIRIVSHDRAGDPDVACAALLHDAVEDHAGDIAPADGPQGAITVLAGRFGERNSCAPSVVTWGQLLPGSFPVHCKGLGADRHQNVI